MDVTDPEKMRTVIQFCVNLGKTPGETKTMIESVTDKPSVCRSLVYKWHRRFSDGRESVADDERSGRPVEFKDEDTVRRVQAKIAEDRRVSLRQVSEALDLSYGTVNRIVKDILEMRRISARWVPRLLSAIEMEKRVDASKRFIQRWQREGQRFLDRIVTVDETWLFFFDPESKQQSMQWKNKSSPPPKKARVTRSAAKHMFIVFYDNKGSILSHAVPAGQTVNAAYYRKVISRDFMHALRKKRPDSVENLILHQDNAPAHRAEDTQLTIQIQLGAEVLSHPPYSPDLSPCDFALFPRLKRQLRGQRFDNLADLKGATQSILASFSKEWYASTFKDWVRRHKKCVDAKGEYFEKL